MLMKIKSVTAYFSFCSKGEFIALAGGWDAGKTTLLKHFKRLLPIGTRSGEIFYEGVLIEEVADLLSAQEIGMVFQNQKTRLLWIQ